MYLAFVELILNSDFPKQTWGILWAMLCSSS